MYVLVKSRYLKQSIQPRAIAGLFMFSRKHPNRGKKRILCLQQSFFETME